ncbi:telomeric repeat-binding factor 2-interacting protein 1 isoform X2 [Festucalex cinctus]
MEQQNFMMASEGQDIIVQCDISPVLFMTEEGEPMSFYLRPGPTKKELQPLIKAGGGIMCNVQKPGSILLIDPVEIGTVSESTAPQYVSIKYIDDCVKKGEQLNLEDYRMKAATVLMSSPRFGGNRNPTGRQAYTPGEDVAILNYVSRRKFEIKGNRLWQQMEKEHVTTHSWQAMKARYKSHLEKKQTKDVQEAEAAREGAQDNEKDEVTDKPSCEENVALPQTNSKPEDPLQTSNPEDPPHTNSADDITQIDLLFAAEKGPSGDAQALQREKKILNPPIQQAATAEAETCDSLRPVEDTDSDSDQSQAKASPQTEKAPKSTQPAQTESESSSSTSDDDEVQPLRVLRRSARYSTRQVRHIQFEDSEEEELYTKKLRSAASPSPSLASVRQLLSSPRTPKRTKSALSSFQEENKEEEPPSKRAKGESSAAAEEDDEETAAQEDEDKEMEVEVAQSQQEDAQQPPSTPQAGPSHVNLLNEAEPQQAKRKKKRELGYVEMATKEFASSDSGSECGEDGFQTPYQTAPVEPLASVAVSPARVDPSLPDQEPDKWETPPEGCLPAGPSSTVGVASKAQLDGEDQEEDDVSPEEVELEEYKQHIRELMKQTNQDLVSVVKALLKTSGDVSDALQLLSDPMSFCTPLWDPRDDGVLKSADPVALKGLQKKYGKVAVSKRMMFLEVER